MQKANQQTKQQNFEKHCDTQIKSSFSQFNENNGSMIHLSRYFHVSVTINAYNSVCQHDTLNIK